METYASFEDRDAAIARIKRQCLDSLSLIAAHQGRRGHEFTATPIRVDGVWEDYWACELDGQPVGDLFYDGFGAVPKGDAFGMLWYRAEIWAEAMAELDERNMAAGR